MRTTVLDAQACQDCLDGLLNALLYVKSKDLIGDIFVVAHFLQQGEVLMGLLEQQPSELLLVNLATLSHTRLYPHEKLDRGLIREYPNSDRQMFDLRRRYR